MSTLTTSAGPRPEEGGRPGMGRGIRSMAVQGTGPQDPSRRAGHPTPGAAATQAASEVFLTPRVVDQAAFDELSRTLREMVREAAKQSAELRASVAQADRIGREIRAGEEAQQENLDLAAAALKRIEEKSRQAEEILEKASNTTSAVTAFEARADELVAKRMAAFEARIDGLIATLAQKAEAAEARVGRASMDLETRLDEIHRDAESSVGPALTRLTAVCERAESLIGRSAVSAQSESGADKGEEPAVPVPGSLGELIHRGETLRQDSAFATRQFDVVRQQADQARSILGESLNDMCAMIDRLTDRADELRRESDRARTVAAEVHTQVDAQAERMRRSAEEAIQAAQPRVDAISSELERALAQAKQIQGESVLAVRVADAAVAQLRQLIVKLEPWQRVISNENMDEAALPEPIRHMISSVREIMQRDLGGIAAALRAAAERAEHVGQRLEPGSAHSGPLVPVTRVGFRQNLSQEPQ